MSVRQQGAVPTASPIGVDRLTAVLEAGERHARSKQLGKATEEFGVDIVSDPTDAKGGIGIPNSVKARVENLSKSKHERANERAKNKNARAHKKSNAVYQESLLKIATKQLEVNTKKEKQKRLAKTNQKDKTKWEKLEGEINILEKEIEAEQIVAERLKPAQSA
jgi:hypothetical protein